MQPPSDDDDLLTDLEELAGNAVGDRPAYGSDHFLLAAARRLAVALAQVRAGGRWPMQGSLGLSGTQPQSRGQLELKAIEAMPARAR